LTSGETIDRGIAHFLEHDLDTLLTIREERLHGFVNGEPINMKVTEKIPMTQDLSPLQIVTWNFCFWKRDTFVASFEANGFGVFTGRIGLFPIDKREAVKVSDESDFQIAEALVRHRERGPSGAVYWGDP
jgi:N-acylneuraminate cytidylyltransferase/CMP-N,N'-diacetyllegionaminic acid synthase